MTAPNRNRLAGRRSGADTRGISAVRTGSTTARLGDAVGLGGQRPDVGVADLELGEVGHRIETRRGTRRLVMRRRGRPAPTRWWPTPGCGPPTPRSARRPTPVASTAVARGHVLGGLGDATQRCAAAAAEPLIGLDRPPARVAHHVALDARRRARPRVGVVFAARRNERRHTLSVTSRRSCDGDVRPCPALTAALDDRRPQSDRSALHDHVPVGVPAAALALVEPLAGRPVAALAVAPPAGGELVLDPARTTLDARHEVLGRRRHQPDLERAPHHTHAAPSRSSTIASRWRRFNCRFRSARHGTPPEWSCVGPLRTFADRRPASRQPAHGARRLAGGAAAPVAASSCGWRTSIASRRRSRTSVASSPTSPRSASTGTGRWCARASASTSTGRRSSGCATMGRVYPCYCTRREIRAEIDAAAAGAARAPARRRVPGNVPRPDATPSAPHVSAAGRRPALRLRADGEVIELVDVHRRPLRRRRRRRRARPRRRRARLQPGRGRRRRRPGRRRRWCAATTC